MYKKKFSEKKFKNTLQCPIITHLLFYVLFYTYELEIERITGN